MTELITDSPSELVAGAKSDTLDLAVANLSLDGNTMLSILYHCRDIIFQSDKCSERRISGQVLLQKWNASEKVFFWNATLMDDPP